MAPWPLESAPIWSPFPPLSGSHPHRGDMTNGGARVPSGPCRWPPAPYPPLPPVAAAVSSPCRRHLCRPIYASLPHRHRIRHPINSSSPHWIHICLQTTTCRCSLSVPPPQPVPRVCVHPPFPVRTHSGRHITHNSRPTGIHRPPYYMALYPSMPSVKDLSSLVEDTLLAPLTEDHSP